MNENVFLFHVSTQIVKYPEIRSSRYYKDFGFGFYCTLLEKQAVRWAVRFDGKGIINQYLYKKNPDLKVLNFPKMTEEWLDFIAMCLGAEKIIIMILWRGLWLMIQFLIMFRILLTEKSAEKISGAWLNSNIRLIKFVFTQK